MKLKRKELFIVLLFSCLISSIILLITSKSSILYPFNNWGDANAFFTMGKGLFSGKIIFKDLFEQKGPILYLIYGIGYLISNKTFLGVFIMEIISSTFLSYYVYKIVTLYLDKKNFYYILPLFLSLLYSNKSFSCGASCEEFCLPFIAATIYELLLYCRSKAINYKTIYKVGFLAGIIFLTKYTLLGFSFAFCVFVFIDLLINRNYKKAFIFPFVFLGGMLSPIVPWLIYFVCNNALYDFINCYILINAKSYGVSNSGLIERLFNCILFFARNLLGSGIQIFIVFLILILFIFNKNKSLLRDKLGLLCLIIFSVLFIYISGTYLFYYVFPIIIFILFSFIGLFLWLEKYLKFNKCVCIILVLISIFIAYMFTPNKELMKFSKEELPQYKFAEIINKIPNAKILNYGALDMGFYTVTGIVPDTKYFHKLNFKYEKYPENIDSLNSYIENKEVDFVIYIKNEKKQIPITEYLEKNYELISEYVNKDLDEVYSYYLYKIK